jgi:hypothetical protein
MFDTKLLDANYDPQEQLLIALGVHPDQVALQKLVAAAQGNSSGLKPDTAAATPATDGSAASAIAPIARPGMVRPVNLPMLPLNVSGPVTDHGHADDLGSMIPASTPATTAPANIATLGSSAPIAIPSAASEVTPPVIARPGDETSAALSMASLAPEDPSALNAIARTSTAIPRLPNTLEKAQTEYDRLVNSPDATGHVPAGGASGIDEIRNPFLRGAAKVGDAALTAMFPSIAREVPGTEMHHRALVNRESGVIGDQLAIQEKSAEITQKGALADQELAKAWKMRNPTKPVPKVLFDSGVPYAIQNGEGEFAIGGTNMPPELKPLADSAVEAHKQRLQEAADAQNNKPDTATQNKQRFQGTIGKVTREAGNKLDPGIITDPRKTAAAISSSKTLTPEEKQFALSYLTANPTPASQALNVVLRGGSYGATRQYSVLDTKNGNRPVYVSADELNRSNNEEPGRYLASGPGTTALNKENLMEDIRGGVQQVRDALNNPKMPEFTAGQRIKIAVAMRERDSHSAVESLITSGTLGSLDPTQEDYLIAHSILAEQAMAMRTVLGAGQGSQDLRSAITATFPGPTTPSKAYGLKQLDAFENTINRLERGIPNVPLKPLAGGNNGGSGNSLIGPIQPGEHTAVGPGNHTIVFRGKKWVDPTNGTEVTGK